LDEIWYGHYAIGVYPKIVHSDFLQSVIPILQMNELEVGSTLSSFAMQCCVKAVSLHATEALRWRGDIARAHS
jgi:hypothetical protein